MSFRRVNPHKVKQHRSYTVPDLAKCLDVHKNTIRNWHREGLEPVDCSRPILFHGATVRDFLGRRNMARKRPCPPGTIYCLRCRDPRRPARGLLEYVRMTPTSGNLRAHCERCGSPMHRRARQEEIAQIMVGCVVQIAEGPANISGKLNPSLICDLRKES